LTTDGAKLVEILPQLTGRGTVSFVRAGAEQKPGAALFEVGAEAGSKPTKLFEAENGNIFRYDWHPDGGSVAFLEFDEEGASALNIWTRADGKIRTVKSFPRLLGRGVGLEDEVSVAWAPDGKSILVVDTFRNPPLTQTMWVVDTDGKDVVPARAGTFARWSTDAKTLFYKEYGASSDWLRLTLDGNETAKFAIPGDRLNPALSPDGKWIALNGGGTQPSAYVFDLSAGKERKVGSGVVLLWISSSAVVVTDVRPCTDAEECFEGPAWKALGTASRLTLSGAKPEVLFPGWTLNADVRL
jgi:Tol biopolymer transport system component